MPLINTSRRRSTCLTGLLLVAALVLAALPSLASARGSASSTRPTGAAASPNAKKASTQKAGANSSIWGDFYPAFPGDLVVKQPDGSMFKGRLTNAEVGGTLEVGGYSVTKASDGWWYYATGRNDKGLIASNRRADKQTRPPGVKRGVGRIRNIWQDGAGRDVRSQFLRQLQVASWKAQAQALASGEPRVFRVPILMLATWWDADKGQTAPQFQEGNTREYFQGLLTGFGGNPRGSLTEFYFENSFGQLVVEVDVYGPYTSVRSMTDRCYYGGVDSGGHPLQDLDPAGMAIGYGGGGAIGMTLEALPQADPEVDFTKYDNNGDRVVDFVGIIHSGPDMAGTADPCHTWSHSMNLSTIGPAIEAQLGLPSGTLALGAPTTDGVVINNVLTIPEVDLTIGVVIHELAHALGESDYYNPNYTSMGTGDWDIMAGGSWFGNPPGSNPTGFNPASRTFQGWIKPRIIHDDARGLTLQPREIMPSPGYTAEKTDPNVVLIPTKWMKAGETDQYGHQWTEYEMRTLVKDGDRGYVVEGFFLENISRTVNAPPIAAKMSRSPYFDRQALSSGLIVWHFNYFKRSSGANTDPDHQEMDVEEFDYNDAIQELQLDLTRGEPTDLVWGAATGITSGTYNPYAYDPGAGDPQKASTFSGSLAPTTTADHPFKVESNPANATLTVKVKGAGDCTLQIVRVVDGKDQPMGEATDSGSVGEEEVVEAPKPEPGDYKARVGDYLACGSYSGSIEFSAPGFTTMGAADTWSDWTEKPTGWAFTNVSPADWTSLDSASDAPGPEVITLDVINVGADERDLSAGFARPALNSVLGREPVVTGRANAMSVPVFDNGGLPTGSVLVEIHQGSTNGPLVARGTVTGLKPYSRKDFSFSFTPPKEGAYDLYTIVDPGNSIREAHEGNNVQKATVWAGPPNPKVLIVDDDGPTDSEDTYAGALAALGIPYAVATDHVQATTMAQYQAVIWEAGLERYQGQMNVDDRREVKKFLDAGGKLLYSSPRAAAALGESTGGTNPLGTPDMPVFFKNYFGVTYADTLQVGGGLVTGLGDVLGSASYRMDVFPGRPLQDAFKLGTWSGSGEDVSIGTAKAVASWNRGGKDSLMAARVDGEGAHKNFKTVFLGFNLYQLTNIDDAVAILDLAMKHFGVAGGGYQAPASSTLIFHSQVRNRISGTDTPVNAIVLGQGAPGPVTLHFRRHGRGGYHSLAMSRGAKPGTWRAVMPGKAVTPDGVDYYIEAGSGVAFDPPAARSQVLAHAIGVALPEVPGAIEILPSSPTRRVLPATGAATTALPLALVLLLASWIGRRRRAA
ncbi:MAG: immune inhibitor A domain-containing protein [Actinomycetota bacterium]